MSQRVPSVSRMAMDGLHVHWCGEIVGRFCTSDVEAGWADDELVGKVQCCKCESEGCCDRADWPSRYAYRTAVELCRCCGAAAIRCGSWSSPYYCKSCGEIVEHANMEAGAILVPLGRHSIMNQISIPGDLPEDEMPAALEKLAAFLASPLHGLVDDWRDLRVEHFFDVVIGAPGEHVPLEDYLAAAASDSIDRDQLVDEMLSWIERRCLDLERTEHEG